MATYSINQVRHIYVAEKLECPVPDTAAPATLGLKATDVHMYMDYMGAGGPSRSDLVDLDKILYITATSSKDLRRSLKKIKLVANPDCLEECKTYFARLLVRQYLSLSEESTLTRHGYGKTGKTPNAEDLLKQVAHSLANSFTAAETPLIKVFVDDSDDVTTEGTLTEVKRGSKIGDITGTVKGIVVEEVEQPWVLGTMSSEPVYFDLTISPPQSDCGCDWAKLGTLEPTTFIEDGKKIADWEYFHMGFRGDIYRGIGYPNVIPTKYLVDPTKKYDVINIHYFYRGDNEAVQRSEKDLTIVLPDDGAHTLANELIAQLNTATGNQFNLKPLA